MNWSHLKKRDVHDLSHNQRTQHCVPLSNKARMKQKGRLQVRLFFIKSRVVVAVRKGANCAVQQKTTDKSQQERFFYVSGLLAPNYTIFFL